MKLDSFGLTIVALRSRPLLESSVGGSVWTVGARAASFSMVSSNRKRGSRSKLHLPVTAFIEDAYSWQRAGCTPSVDTDKEGFQLAPHGTGQHIVMTKSHKKDVLQRTGIQGADKPGNTLRHVARHDGHFEQSNCGGSYMLGGSSVPSGRKSVGSWLIVMPRDWCLARPRKAGIQTGTGGHVRQAPREHPWMVTCTSRCT